jgi:A/G-specific adenine glycosylase
MLVKQREAGDIWQGLYELPLFETESPVDSQLLKQTIGEVLQSWLGMAPTDLEVGPEMKHQLTHRTIKAQFLKANYNRKPARIPEKMRIVRYEELKSLPISRLIDRYLSKK